MARRTLKREDKSKKKEKPVYIECIRCEEKILDSDYLYMDNKSKLYPTNRIPFCRNCLMELYDYYYYNYNENYYMAIDQLCRIMDMPFTAKKAESAIRGYESGRYKHPVTCLLGMARRYEKEHIYTDSPKEDISNVYNLHYNISRDNIKSSESKIKEEIPRWLLKLNLDEHMLEEALGLFRSLENNVENESIITKKYMQLTVISYCNWVNGAYNALKASEIDNYKKAFDQNLKILGVDPETLRSDQSQEKKFGLTTKMMEEISPADYFGNEEKMKELDETRYIDEQDEYNRNHLIRSMVNHLRGERDFADITYDELDLFDIEDESGIQNLITGAIVDSDIEEDEEDEPEN